ncbi:cobaltochelatase subunit CobN [Stenotrophomonas sp. S39]|nr:cobaltochelatase subunit CobN [Stenotrophomonas sp. S39]
MATSPTRFLADELRVDVLNPAWTSAMKAKGYDGTLEVLKTTDNTRGWQVAERAECVRISGRRSMTLAFAIRATKASQSGSSNLPRRHRCKSSSVFDRRSQEATGIRPSKRETNCSGLWSI